jgi:threonine dehydrogenase-like Zn-dependent dehydrogenase
MQGYVIAGPGEAEWRELPVPEINPFGALIEPVIVSPCTSDIHLLTTGAASLPYLVGKPIGHEMAGVVREVGSEVKDFKPGDRVVVPATLVDMRSREAQEGHPKLANTNMYVGVDDPDRGGSFVDLYYLLDADMNLAHVPDSVSWEQAVMIPDMCATSFEGVREMDISYGDSVAIIGVGPVGLMAVQAAVLKGAGRIFVVGSRQVSFDKARDFGATDLIDYHDADWTDRITEANGRPVDSVLVAGGRAPALSDALKLVKWGGVVSNLVAYFEDETVPIVSAQWGFGYSDKVIKAVGCNGGRVYMEKLLSLVEHGRIHPEQIITHRFHGKDKAAEACQLFIDQDRSMIKPVVYFG